jgi:hypothetical protein
MYNNKLEFYVGSSIAAGRATHAGQVSRDARLREIPWSSRFGVGRGANDPTL